MVRTNLRVQNGARDVYKPMALTAYNGGGVYSSGGAYKTTTQYINTATFDRRCPPYKHGSVIVLYSGPISPGGASAWYANGSNHSVANLQVVIEGTADYDPNSTNKLNNRSVEQFNFDGLVSKFDAARAANSKLTSWGLSASLLSFHLGGSDTAALGGDLAYQYATKGGWGDSTIASAQSVLDSSNFGVAPQTVQPSALAPQQLLGRM